MENVQTPAQTQNQNPNQLTVEFAQYIKSLRLQKQWTRDELAERSKVNVYTLKHFERTGQISLERFFRLCDALEAMEVVEQFVTSVKPRARLDIDDWQFPQRQRGRRRSHKTVEQAEIQA